MIIIANGASAETSIDDNSRRSFDNYAEFQAPRDGNLSEMDELPIPALRTPDSCPCASGSDRHRRGGRCRSGRPGTATLGGALEDRLNRVRATGETATESP